MKFFARRYSPEYKQLMQSKFESCIQPENVREGPSSKKFCYRNQSTRQGGLLDGIDGIQLAGGEIAKAIRNVAMVVESIYQAAQ